MGERSSAHVALGAAIRSRRRERKISQEELAHLSGLHRTYVGGIERGERNPSYANLLKIADALELSPSVLLARAERVEDDGRGPHRGGPGDAGTVTRLPRREPAGSSRRTG